MISLAAAAIITTVVTGPLPLKVYGPIIIKFSPGGHVTEAILDAELKIDGPCLSGCAWAAILNRNRLSCLTPRAVLAFHAFRNPGVGGRIDAANEYRENQLPENTRKFVGKFLNGEKLTYRTGKWLLARGIGRKCK